MVPLFFGSPACCYLMAVLSHLVYTIVFLTCKGNVQAPAAGGLATCLIITCASLLSYAVSLHANEVFEHAKAFLGVGVAVMVGLVLGVPIIFGITHTWEPWGYFLVVWMVALLVIIVHDFVFMGLYVDHLPVFRFTQRIGRPTDRDDGAV